MPPRVDGVFLIPMPGICQTLFEIHSRNPAKLAKLARIHDLAGRAIGLGSIPSEVADIADSASTGFSELFDRDFTASAAIEVGASRCHCLPVVWMVRHSRSPLAHVMHFRG